MTLITHFRTKKYAIFASDSMQRNELTGKVTQSQKIFKFGNNHLLATYGNVFDEVDKFIKKGNHSKERLISILKKHEESAKEMLIKKEEHTSGIGCLLISKNKSTLISKWYIWLDSNMPLYRIELRVNNEFCYPLGDQIIKNDLEIICSNPVFFNEILESNNRVVNKSWYSNIIKCFNDSLPEPEFTLNKIEDISVIIEVIKRFYLSVYENKNLHQGIIGGDIWLSYIDLDTNIIQEPIVILNREIKNQVVLNEDPENKEAKKIDDFWDNQLF